MVSFGRMIRNCDRDIPVFLITAYPDLMKRVCPLSASERREITVRRNYATPPALVI
jgi:hypothetical protein